MNCANSKKTRRVSGENLLVQIAKMCHTKLQTCCNLENSELQASHGATAAVHPFYVSSSTSSAPPPHPPLPLTPFPSLLLPLLPPPPVLIAIPLKYTSEWATNKRQIRPH